MLKRKVVVICGPTASGKTALAVQLAKKFNGEIISADSRQVYRGMDIGTGKDLVEYGSIPYHLIDVVSPKKQYTLADWLPAARRAIDQIEKRGKLPIVCGGTGLYITALLDGFVLPTNTLSAKQALALRKRLQQMSLPLLLKKLRQVDSKTYRVIDRHNRRRVERALEIYYQSGKPKSKWQKKEDSPYEFLVLGLQKPRGILYQRIENRLRARLGQGMVAEVQRLKKSGLSWKRLALFGLEYAAVAQYLRGVMTRNQLTAVLNREIKDFARRQMVWFGRDQRIIWVKNKTSAVRQVQKFMKRSKR